MREISTDLQTHLNGEVTTLATIWKMTRRDGVVMGFTDHDRDLTVGEVTYSAATGFTPSAVASSASLQVDNLDMEGMLHADAISESDIMAGLYDFAEIEIKQVNYAAPEDGQIFLRRGWLGEVRLEQGRFIAEVRGLTQKLTQTIGARYSAACRANLGDARCGVTMTGYTVTGAIDGITSRSVFDDAARTEEESYFAGGVITFTSGENTGLSMEVKAFSEGEIILSLPMPFPIATGDAYSLKAGCDKRFETCVSRFDNAASFRGEPHVPGLDKMLETASTRNPEE